MDNCSSCFVQRQAMEGTVNNCSSGFLFSEGAEHNCSSYMFRARRWKEERATVVQICVPHQAIEGQWTMDNCSPDFFRHNAMRGAMDNSRAQVDTCIKGTRVSLYCQANGAPREAPKAQGDGSGNGRRWWRGLCFGAKCVRAKSVEGCEEFAARVGLGSHVGANSATTCALCL